MWGVFSSMVAVTEHGAAFTDGNGFFRMFASSTGGMQMNVEGSSSAPRVFEVTPASSKSDMVLHLARINFKIVAFGMRWEFFAGQAELANGIKIEQVRPNDPPALDFTAQHPIKNNADWSLFAGVDAKLESILGSDDLLTVRWTVAKAGMPLALAPREVVRITIADDLSGLTCFEAMAQGVYV